jgi:hypothetical protein
MIKATREHSCEFQLAAVVATRRSFRANASDQEVVEISYDVVYRGQMLARLHYLWWVIVNFISAYAAMPS